MKKIIHVFIGFLCASITVSLTACSAVHEKTLFEQIKESPAARLELPEGREMLVDSEIASLRLFADLNIQASPFEPADGEEDWLYRIVFNPAEKVNGADEITVSFHQDYVQVNSEYFLSKENVPYENILEWAEGKFRYFMDDIAGLREGRYVLDHPAAEITAVPYLLVQNGRMTVIQDIAVSYQPSGNVIYSDGEISVQTVYADQTCKWTFARTDDDMLVFSADRSMIPDKWENWEDGMRFVFTED